MANSKQAVPLHDEGLSAIRRIETLAGLLAALGQEADSPPVPSLLVAETGG